MRQQLFNGRDFKGVVFLDGLYIIENSILFTFDGTNLTEEKIFTKEIKNIKSTTTNLCVSLDKEAKIYDSSMIIH